MMAAPNPKADAKVAHDVANEVMERAAAEIIATVREVTSEYTFRLPDAEATERYWTLQHELLVGLLAKAMGDWVRINVGMRE